MELINKFIEYCKIYTTSNDESTATPSSSNQLVLLEKLNQELLDLGVESHIDEFGRVYGYLEGNLNYPSIGLCAHVDTASECSGENVNPQIHPNYDGKDIPIGNGYVLSINDFPELTSFKNKTLITTDGSTLLGADDKAGIAIIMQTVSNLTKVDKDKRRSIAILFTPDEEIGRGPEHFDRKAFKCDYAYTIDGGNIHEISYENFNAASCEVKIKGKSIHPGDAKGKMVNAVNVLAKFMSFMPQDKVPELTEGHEGFNHCLFIKGDTENSEAYYIIRNHNLTKLEQQKLDFINAKNKTLEFYPKAQIEVSFTDEYRNMKEIIDQHPEVLSSIENAFEKAKKDYHYVPTRGGTDGATFSFLGCPCPNLGTGSRNHHGRFEFAIKEEMEEMVDILSYLYSI